MTVSKLNNYGPEDLRDSGHKGDGDALLVDPSKSKRLSEIRNRSVLKYRNEIAESPVQNFDLRLQDETSVQLQIARDIIDRKIDDILSSLPQGRKRRLFTIRYGTVDSIKAMDLKASFKLLGLDTNRVKLKSLTEMNYFGNKIKQ